MASGFAPGAIGQPAQAPAMLAPKKKPSVLGTPSGAAPVGVPAGYQPPVTRPAAPGSPSLGGLQTAVGGVTDAQGRTTTQAPAGWSGYAPGAGPGSGGTMTNMGPGQPGGSGFTAVNPTHPVSMPAPGVTPVTGGPLTESVPTLGGAPPVQGGPVGVAPPPATPKPLNLEQTLTNQFQTGAPANPRLGATQGLVDQAAQGLNSGPNRTDIAKQAFTDYLSQSGDQFNKDVRNITQRNAAAGRLGSGMYGSDLVDAATTADKNRTYAGNQLAQDLANGTISDQFNRVGVLGNLEGQQSGQAQQSLQNLLGYGQQSFNNQITNQQQQQSIDDQQFRQYLALLGLQG